MPLAIGNGIGIPFGGTTPFDPSSISVGGVKLLKQQLLTKRTPTLGGIIYDERSNKGSARPVQTGGCYVFDNTNDKVNMPADVVLSGDFTLTGWYYRGDVTARDAFISRGDTVVFAEFVNATTWNLKFDDATQTGSI
jgi:hypothetical protein